MKTFCCNIFLIIAYWCESTKCFKRLHQEYATHFQPITCELVLQNLCLIGKSEIHIVHWAGRASVESTDVSPA